MSGYLTTMGIRVLLASAAIVLLTTPAFAQGPAVRGGTNVNPDQLSVGGQYEFGPLNDRFWLQPSGDFGVGNSAKLVAFNLDVMYRRGLTRNSIWSLYGGGGPAINWYKLNGYSQTEPGVNVAGGLLHRSGLFTEVRVGFLESPQLRFGAGYTFGRNRAATPPRRPTSRRR